MIIPKKKKKKKACIKESESAIFLNTKSVISTRGALGAALCVSGDPVVQRRMHVLRAGAGWPARAARELAATHVDKSLWN